MWLSPPPPLLVGEAIPVPVLKGVLERRGGWLMGSNRKGGALVVRVSGDGGRTWTDRGIAARSDRPDLGDGNLVAQEDGTVALSYRDNRPPEFAIRVVRSRDGGRSWGSPETVEEGGRGLWAPFLLAHRSGGLTAFFDDESAPALARKAGHQWISARRFVGGEWGPKALVSRDAGENLSRDGMFVAVELGGGQIVGAVEDVAERDPRPSGIYRVHSEDGGRSWRRDGAIFLARWPHMAVAPALVRLPGGKLLCAFGTDEGLPQPSRSGTPPDRMPLETWGCLSGDEGRSWGAAFPIHRGTSRDYLAALTPRKGGAWLNVLDFDRGPLLIPISVR